MQCVLSVFFPWRALNPFAHQQSQVLSMLRMEEGDTSRDWVAWEFERTRRPHAEVSIQSMKYGIRVHVRPRKIEIKVFESAIFSISSGK